MKAVTPKVGIDIRAANGKTTGLGVYTKNLAEHLVRANKGEFQFCFYHRNSSANLNTVGRIWRENVELLPQALRDKVDLLHIPAFAPPVVKFFKLVVTVHDLIGMVFPNQLGWPSRFYWGRWLPWTLTRADAIIADSEQTKKDIRNHLRVPESKIHVIYPSGHENFWRSEPRALEPLKSKFGLMRNYFLCVGTLEPRKNLARVIAAFIRFRQKNQDFQLVIAGSKDFAYGRVFKSLLSDIGDGMQGIRFTGYVAHEELNALYGAARAFIYPSLYEGFGIPILEAMACGTPVITSNQSSIPEVTGGAACVVDPNDTGAISNAMAHLAGNERYRSELIAKGFEQIKKFSWQKTAEQTLKVYESLL